MLVTLFSHEHNRNQSRRGWPERKTSDPKLVVPSRMHCLWAGQLNRSKEQQNHPYSNYLGFIIPFVLAAWEVSFGLWLQTQLCSKAGFKGYRETSSPQLTSLLRACGRGGEDPQ